MRSLAMAALVALAVALLSPSVSAAPLTCPMLTFTDIGGDVQTIGGLPLPPGADVASLDLLGGTMEYQGTAVLFSFKVAQAPKPHDQRFDRYWLGFDVVLSDHREYWDLRMAGNDAYDSGALIGSNEVGNPLVATLPVTWNGSLATFTFDTGMLQPYYGRPVELASPRAISDGHNPLGLAGQSAGGGTYNDWAGDGGEQSPVLPHCERQEDAPAQPTGDGAIHGAPGSGITNMLGILVAVVALRRKTNH